MKSLFIVLISTLLSLPAFSLSVDTSKSIFQWTGKKVTGEHTGKIKLKSANVKMDKAKPVSADFVMDLSTVTVEDLTGKWQKKLLDHMKSADFFEISKFPTATLKLTKITDKMADGSLTIKGKSHPVKVPFKKVKNSYVGTLKFDRTKFGMTYKSGNFFKGLGDKMIHDEVSVAFTVVVK